MTEAGVPCPQLAAVRTLAAAADPAPGRDALLAHAAGCAECGKFLRRNAPDLLLAAFNLDLSAPAPLEARELLPKLPARRDWRWPAAVAALLVAGIGFAVYRVSPALAGNASAPQLAHARQAPPAIAAPVLAVSASAEPVIESGADNYSVSEYEAAGFDGKPVHWVRLRSDDAAPAADSVPLSSAAVSAGAVRS